MSAGGGEHVLQAGAYRAVLTEVGGGVRVLQHEGRDLVRSYGAGRVRHRYAGALLAPWPNRVADGAYRFEGRTHQLPLTEPERGNALHGLVEWDRFEVVGGARGPSTGVTLVDRLVPRTGYPFEVEVEVRYDLDPDAGLRTTVRGRCTGEGPAPWGTAAHPYLQAGTPQVDECHLTVPAGRVLEVTPDRLLPVGLVDVAGTDLDFRDGRPVGATRVDHAYTDLHPDTDGLVRVRMTGPGGAGVQCTWDPVVLPWVQVHTADTPGEPETDRTAMAVEPMSCAPDAFNSGDGLVVLRPGHEHVASWLLGAG